MDDRIRVLREDIADALAKIEHQFDRIKALDERLREIEREDAEVRGLFDDAPEDKL